MRLWTPTTQTIVQATPVAGSVAPWAVDETLLPDYSDTFSGSASLADRGWTIYNGATIATQTVANGEVNLVSTTGGSAGAWWYSQVSGPTLRENGALVYKLITGNFDVRMRCRLRNAAGTGNPATAPLEWRFLGLQAQDPAGLVSGEFNYVHFAGGSDPNGTLRFEWKTTDDDGATPQSTFGSDAIGATMDIDIRMTRIGQVFRGYWRLTSATRVLASDAGWTESTYGGAASIQRDANVPARSGGAAFVEMPDTLAVGIMPPYGGPQATIDLQSWIEEIQGKRLAA